MADELSLRCSYLKITEEEDEIVELEEITGAGKSNIDLAIVG